MPINVPQTHTISSARYFPSGDPSGPSVAIAPTSISANGSIEAALPGLHDWVDAANVTDNQGAIVRLASWAGCTLALEEAPHQPADGLDSGQHGFVTVPDALAEQLESGPDSGDDR